MKVLQLVAAMTVVLLVGTGSQAAVAAPMHLPLSANWQFTAKNSLITQVHGRHRRCVKRRGRPHRHAWRRGRLRRIWCGRRWRGRGRPKNWSRRGCFSIGPIWYCPR